MIDEACPDVRTRPPQAGAPLVDAFDRSVRYLRLSVTDRCNFRCVYCMPAGRIAAQPARHLLDDDEIVRIVSVMAMLGVERLRITGGEPLVRKGIVALVERLAGVPGVREVAMTTNGQQLAPLAQALRDAGLGSLNVSLDALDPARFATLSRGGSLRAVVAGIDAALEAGVPDVKINTVALVGPPDDFARVCAWAWDRGVTPRFIELMPVGRLAAHGELGFVSGADVLAGLGRSFPLAPARSRDGVARGPAQYYAVEAGPYAGRRVGLIRAMTDRDFCDRCNRVRLTAAGDLRPCLGRDTGASLRDLVRDPRVDDLALEAALRDVLRLKGRGHGLRVADGAPLALMASVGG